MHNAEMDFSFFYHDFLLRVAIGAAVVFSLLLLVCVGTPSRSPVLSRRHGGH